MLIRTLLKLCLIVIFTLYYSALFAQGGSISDEEFERALKDFVNENLVEFGVDVIAQERFLVEQMRLINTEVQSRYKNLGELRDEYFAGLYSPRYTP